MNEFYKRHVSESPLQHTDWEGFRDPDEMIYRVYTRIQDQQEQYVDGLLDEHNEIGHDADALGGLARRTGAALHAPALFADGAPDGRSPI